MAKYKLCDWEDNGYHDSYFYGVYFDDADGQLHHASLGATAYAGGYGFDDSYLYPTPEIVELARKQFVPLIYSAISAAEQRDVLKPSDAAPGTILRLLVPHKSRKAGETLEAGTKIRVNTCNAFGTFYRKGYNQPGRDNRSVVGTVLGKPAVLIRVPLEKCRLDKEPLSAAELVARAEELSHEYQFGASFGCRAWLSNNWAAKVAEAAKKELVAA
jgi:hypothetical protein